VNIHPVQTSTFRPEALSEVLHHQRRFGGGFS
jgi:hypothetical protein